MKEKANDSAMSDNQMCPAKIQSSLHICAVIRIITWRILYGRYVFSRGGSNINMPLPPPAASITGPYHTPS